MGTGLSDRSINKGRLSLRTRILITAALTVLVVSLLFLGVVSIMKGATNRAVPTSTAASMATGSQQPGIMIGNAQIPIYPGVTNVQTVTETNPLKTTIN